MARLSLIARCACGGPANTIPAPSLQVLDGDTVVCQGRSRDLAGIDAPELGQRCEANGRLYACGLNAAFALAKRIALEPADCEPVPRRPIEVVCHVGETSLSDLQVSDGYAFAKADAPATLRMSERAARTAHLGLWRGAHVVPQAWRAGERLLSEEDVPAEPCPVIGLRSGEYQRYIVPTDRSYTVYRTEAGTVRFCSDEAARAAGSTGCRSLAS